MLSGSYNSSNSSKLTEEQRKLQEYTCRNRLDKQAQKAIESLTEITEQRELLKILEETPENKIRKKSNFVTEHCIQIEKKGLVRWSSPTTPGGHQIMLKKYMKEKQFDYKAQEQMRKLP